MELTGIVIGIALLEYIIIVFLCGQARARSGGGGARDHRRCEIRTLFRVQQNTLEQLIVFLPAMLLFGTFVSDPVGAGLGLVFVAGRAMLRARLLPRPG